MTQGYGPDHGQQPPWGQSGQNPPPPPQQPQWGASEQAPPAQQRQWGQASPAAAPAGYPGAGYPGAVGASSGTSTAGSAGPASPVAKLIQWMFFATLAVIVVRLIGNVIVFATQFALGNATSSALFGAGIVSILVLLVNCLVTLALLVLAVMVIVQASGRGRTGAIIIIATVILSVVTYGILYGILLAIMYNSTDYGLVGIMAIVYLIFEIIRVLIVFAVLLYGALMSRGWAKQNA